jgi:hypothetical protein|uniref:Uncharacterized protein n=1 Tax=viral metagenome TaxID=1070528 RepID=A0A6C0BJS3_9ZZZZ
MDTASSLPPLPPVPKAQPVPKVPPVSKVLPPVSHPPSVQANSGGVPASTVSTTLKSDYRCFYLPNLKTVYLKLLNDNLVTLIEYIYAHTEVPPYDSPEVRISLSMQMILSSDQLVPIHVSTKIAKDFDLLRYDTQYTNQWANPARKRRQLAHELDLLKKHTEIDDAISLNLSDHNATPLTTEGFDLHSSISTLNVSSSCPIPADEAESGNCSIM